MQAKFYLGGAAAAVALAGVGVGAKDRLADKGAPFINPIELARSICGDDAAGMAKRRAYFVRIASAYAQESDAEGIPGAAPARIGDISYAITTTNPLAQAYFDRGIAEMWNFNHGEAITSFKAAEAADPDCAMCYWAEALAYGPNINAPMADDDVAPSYAALRKALALRDKANGKERALINALNYRYGPAPVADRSKLDNAYADAMDETAKKFADDDFIATLAAEANMDTQPWDYWEPDGRAGKGRTDRTMELLDGVLARSPDHPGAIHFYIHMTEASNDPYRAAPYAEKLAALTPGLGHLIHMPSHVYYRIGRFKDSIATNIEAVAADEQFIAENKASVFYEYGYYTHNVHFLMTSAQMAGDGPTALAMAKKLDAKLPADLAAVVPLGLPIKAAPYYAMAQFAGPQAILNLPDPGEPYLQAAWRYARGEAFARLGDAENTKREADAIAAIIAATDFAPLESLMVPATQIVTIEQKIIEARAAAAEGDFKSAIAAMETAVAEQEALPYTEPPFWYYPAKQTLAAMVLRAGDAERAEQLFIEALAEAPNNGWVLYGLSRSYEAQHDRNGAKFAERLFKDAWAGDRKSLTLAQL